MTATDPRDTSRNPSALRVRSRRRRAALVLVSSVTAALVLSPLGQRPITTSDEARFALLAQDVLQRGAWYGTQLRGELFRDKPPLYPWSIAALSLARGRVTEATAQFPVALAAVVASVFTFLLGDRLFGGRAGVWAALILATSYGFFGHSQLVLPDMMVVGFAAIAYYAFWRSVSPSAGRRSIVAFYAAVALGVFAKGPVGLVPMLAVGVWLLTEHGVRGLRRLWSPGGVCAFALLTSVWLVPYLAFGSRTFASKVLWRDWLTWYLGTPGLASLTNGALGFMPWTLVLALPLSRMRDDWKNPSVRFAFLTFVVPLAVMLLSHNQRARYVLPIYEGAALLVAWWAVAGGRAPAAAVRVVRWGAPIVMLAGGAALAVPWYEASHRQPVSGLGWSILALGAGVALIGVAISWSLWTRRPAFLIQSVIIVMVLGLSVGIRVHDAWVNQTQDFPGLAARVAQLAGHGQVGVVGPRYYPLDFYLGRPVMEPADVNDFMQRAERPVVVLNRRTWERVRDQIPSDVRPLDIIRVRGQDVLIVGVPRG